MLLLSGVVRRCNIQSQVHEIVIQESWWLGPLYVASLCWCNGRLSVCIMISLQHQEQLSTPFSFRVNIVCFFILVILFSLSSFYLLYFISVFKRQGNQGCVFEDSAFFQIPNICVPDDQASPEVTFCWQGHERPPFQMKFYFESECSENWHWEIKWMNTITSTFL